MEKNLLLMALPVCFAMMMAQPVQAQFYNPRLQNPSSVDANPGYRVDPRQGYCLTHDCFAAGATCPPPGCPCDCCCGEVSRTVIRLIIYPSASGQAAVVQQIPLTGANPESVYNPTAHARTAVVRPPASPLPPASSGSYRQYQYKF
jgi:hypothetical protein